MAKFFLLEDDPNRVAGFEAALDGHELHHAIDVDAAIAVFSPPYDLLLLDHDLGGEVFVSSDHSNTGAAFARYLAEHHPADLCDVIVHSWNPDGAKTIAGTLSDAGWIGVVQMPFSGALLRTLRMAPQGGTDTPPTSADGIATQPSSSCSDHMDAEGKPR